MNYLLPPTYCKTVCYMPLWVVKKHFNAGNGEWRDDSINIFCCEKEERTIGTSMSYASFEIATKEEYEAYINSKK